MMESKNILSITFESHRIYQVSGGSHFYEIIWYRRSEKPDYLRVSTSENPRSPGIFRRGASQLKYGDMAEHVVEYEMDHSYFFRGGIF